MKRIDDAASSLLPGVWSRALLGAVIGCSLGISGIPGASAQQMSTGGRFGFSSSLGSGGASAPTSNTIRDIVVQGNRRIETPTILTYMKVQPGEPFADDKIDQSLKALYATGLFADVTMRREGNDLIVRVVENPIINRIAFEGNRKMKEENLLQEIQLKPRQVYTRAKVQADLQRVLTVYRRSGRFAATVEPKVIQLPENRVDLVFEINEGATTGINTIRFIGNKKYSDGTLRDAISTKETAWWRILSSSDTYDPDRLTYDRELLRRFYLAHGYADFRVTTAVAELSPQRDGFYITFVIEEGERYKFGKLSITSRIRGIDGEEFMSAIQMSEGDWYDADLLEKSIEEITYRLGTRGYAFVDVRPDIDRDRNGHIIGVNFVINEAPRVYVERINVTGNVRTLDKVIRREMRLAEGDAFNAAKVRRSRQRIRGLGFFDKVDIEEAPGAAQDKVALNVKVEEKSTGELSFGAGYSTTDSLLADIGIRERNLLGRGQDLRLGFVLSGRRQQADLGFTEPYFLDREMAAGVDIFTRRLDLQDRSGYNQSSSGFIPRLTYPITESLSQQVGYTLRQDRIYDVDPGAAFIIQQSVGNAVTSSLNQALTYDRRDDKLEPTKGYIIKFGNDVAGLGGNQRYLRFLLEGTYYYPFSDTWVLSAGSTFGTIFGYGGKDVRITDRYFLGGDNLRGFALGGAGPRDIPSGNSVGGNNLMTNRLQLSFPLGLPNELGILGRTFVDGGMLFGVDGQTSTIEDTKTYRMSVGVGVSWKSPFGPIAVDLGYPVMKEHFDKKELFRFTFGTRF